MTNIPLLEYFEAVFSEEDKSQLLTSNTLSNISDTTNEEWETIESDFIQLLNNQNKLQNFGVLTNDTAGGFIENIFNNCDENTFVIASITHSKVNEGLSKITHKYIVSAEDIKNDTLLDIYTKYKNSGCSKILIYLGGIIEHTLVPMQYLYDIKAFFVSKDVIPTFVLDDVGSMFLISKDYNIFDYIIFNSYSLIPEFKGGILLYNKKMPQPVIGGKDKALNIWIDLLKKILIKKDNILQFNEMLLKYFSEYTHLFKIFNVPHIFCLSYKNNTNFNIIIDKYKNKLKEYNIICEDCAIIIRCNHFLCQDIDNITVGLSLLMKVLNRCNTLN